MLMALLKNKGTRTAKDIAREILKFDDSQVEYYEQITKQMPGKVLAKRREWILEKDSSVEGFNDGTNAGLTSGQTIFHLHIHLIPRRKGDVENPRGGVRHVIPTKGSY